MSAPFQRTRDSLLDLAPCCFGHFSTFSRIPLQRCRPHRLDLRGVTRSWSKQIAPIELEAFSLSLARRQGLPEHWPSLAGPIAGSRMNTVPLFGFIFPGFPEFDGIMEPSSKHWSPQFAWTLWPTYLMNECRSKSGRYVAPTNKHTIPCGSVDSTRGLDS
jgi:hypothetical protein